MLTLDVLICTFNKGIVRIEDVILPQREGIHYIVSYQYNDERYIELIPESVKNRTDVTLYTYHGQGLSANRNLALEKATSDLIMYADDDEHICENAFDDIFKVFERDKDVDVAFFTASTYTGRPLKDYPAEEHDIKQMPEKYSISTIEMVCRRTSVQGVIRFDERFGLGTRFLTCGEEDIWMEDAFNAKLNMRYYPVKIVETSTMLKKKMIYVDSGVQRSYGAQMYYRYKAKAWWICFKFALRSTAERRCHFWGMMKHLSEGIRYMQRTH